MKRALMPMLALLLSLGLFAQKAAPKPEAKKELRCKTEQNAGNCRWVHGRLSAYNGSPTFRLWHIGTKHIYGVYSNIPDFRYSLDNEDPRIPPEIPICAFGNEIFADFEICPLEPFKEGSMQGACINSAKKIIERRDNDPPEWCRKQFANKPPVISK